MSLKSTITVLLAAAVMVFGFAGSGNISQFLDPRAVWIVLGGTIVAGAISFELDRIVGLFRTFFVRVVLRRRENFPELISQLMELAGLYRSGSPVFSERAKGSSDAFLREAMEAVGDNLMPPDDLVRVLRERTETLFQREYEEVIQFRALGKYPPAFGLMGTTLSMIDLLRRLGNPGEQARIGPALAVGLVATFYGLCMANLLFIPVSESLAETTRRHKTKNLVICEGVRLILLKTNPMVLAEELNSFLLPAERVDWKTSMRSKEKMAA